MIIVHSVLKIKPGLVNAAVFILSIRSVPVAEWLALLMSEHQVPDWN